MTLSAEPITTAPEGVCLRAADAVECEAAGGTVESALRWSIANSFHTEVVLWRGEPCAYWGYRPTSLTSHECYVWMLTTPTVDQCRTAFGKRTVAEFRKLAQLYPRMIVQVDPAHTLALKWLSWLGFTHLVDYPPYILMLADRRN